MEPDTSDPRHHVTARALRRRWPLVALVALLAAGAALALANSRPATYSSTAQVLLRPLDANSLSTDATTSSQQIVVAMQTEAGLVASLAVTDRVGDRLGAKVEPGTPAVSVTVPSNTEILQIVYTAPTAGAAQRGANAFARAYLDFRAAQSVTVRDAQLQNLEEQLGTTTDRLRGAAKATTPEAAAQVQVFANRIASLQENLSTLRAQSTDPGTVITPARFPHRPEGLRPQVVTLAGGLLGALLGLLSAVWWERRDDRVRAALDDSVAGLPVLAVLPAEDDRVLARSTAAPTAVDAYRRLRTVLAAATTSPSVVAVSPAGAGVPDARVAVNLAISLVHAGYTVALVDASTGSSPVSSLLDLPAEPGLSDALASDVAQDVAFEDVGGLLVLPSGGSVPAAQDAYGGERFAVVLAHIREVTDYVVLWTSPLAEPAGAAVARLADHVLVLATEGRTTHTEVEQVAGRGLPVDLPLCGVVVAPRPPRHSRRPAPRQEEEPIAPEREPAATDADPSAGASVDASSEETTTLSVRG
jgi:Mrp family chromosome partitioning ATPase